MSPEEREMMQFILQSQSDAAEEHRKAMKRMDRMDAHLDRMDKQLDKQSADIQALARISRDLVEVERRHSKRLDRLDKLNP